MDLENAAQRLQRDQAKMRGRRRLEISASAKREAEQRKRQQQRMAAEREKQKRHAAKVEQYYQQCERSLHVKHLSPNNSSLMLQATSIHGEGDKIALPPSVLTFLTESGSDDDEIMASSTAAGSPWIFRIGIVNPAYTFPASPILKNMTFPDEEEDEMNVEEDDDDDDEEEEERNPKEAFLDELRYRYLAYTHGTVVEFTQDEGHVGLPEPIARALLAKRPHHSSTVIPVKRTVDPAKMASAQDSNDDEQAVEAMVVAKADDDEKTPGHLAYGAFDVPDLPIEISMVKIPKGRTCELVPTHEAISNGFYNLKDVKLVLEQSLIRTRATLSVGDLVYTWHRGIKFDLTVTQVTPAMYQTVTCINTDIEVDFGEVPGLTDATKSEGTEPSSATGYTLGSSSDVPVSTTIPAAKIKARKVDDLLAEPPSTQTEGVCTIQIRAGAGHGRRRFDVNKAKLRDLFAFSATIDDIPDRFQLVSRFPRREFRLDATSATMTLQEAGLQAGQELLMVEKL